MTGIMNVKTQMVLLLPPIRKYAGRHLAKQPSKSIK